MTFGLFFMRDHRWSTPSTQFLKVVGTGDVAIRNRISDRRSRWCKITKITTDVHTRQTVIEILREISRFFLYFFEERLIWWPYSFINMFTITDILIKTNFTIHSSSVVFIAKHISPHTLLSSLRVTNVLNYWRSHLSLSQLWAVFCTSRRFAVLSSRQIWLIHRSLGLLARNVFHRTACVKKHF